MDVASFSQTQMTDVGLIQLATLDWVILGMDSTSITDVGIGAVASSCHQLRTLNVTN
eukprot:COSAG06_NODE_62466_length_265_cov_0.608434_1_plen_56_part_10